MAPSIEEACAALFQEAKDIAEAPMVFPPSTPETFGEAVRDLAFAILASVEEGCLLGLSDEYHAVIRLIFSKERERVERLA